MPENQEILEYKDILSLVISLLSVVIALMAYFRASKLSEQMNFLTERSLRSGNLSKYSSELNSLRANLDPKIKTIQTKAHLALIDIYPLVNSFGSKPPSGRLRDITKKIIVLWFNNFCCKLTRENALDIYGRIIELLYVRPVESKRGFLDNLIILFERKYQNKITRYLGRSFIEDNEFNDLLTEYFNHLEDPIGLYEFGMEKASPVFKDLSSLHDEIESAADKLDQLLKENEIEEVRLEEAPRLKREIESYIEKLRVLEKFYLLENTLHYNHNIHLKNQVLIVLFCLYLIESYWYWGKSVPT